LCPPQARPSLELADLVRRHGPAFLARHPQLGAPQRRALRDVACCRTPALGGHVYRCAACGVRHAVYHSCRNRHCPKCQGAVQARWWAREQAHLLPVEYFHVVFTLPEAVARLRLTNRAVLYEGLFRCAWQTLQEVTADPRHLGAEVGAVFVLHTWGQTLTHHPHVHGLVTGGGLARDAAGTLRWVSCRRGFLVSVKVLSRVFRGKYLAWLRHLHQHGQLPWRDEGAPLRQTTAFAAWLRPLYATNWVVYAKRPCAGPEVVLKYLARYTQRVALSNRRLLELRAGKVTFAYQDYRHRQRPRRLTLGVEEFLRRWLQHVLPRGFVKVRHYGLLANRGQAEKLALCRRLLLALGLVLGWWLPPGEAGGQGPVCPACGGVVWLKVEDLRRPAYQAWPEEGEALDSS
jgi:Putative transposase/Transposase zinc-binding domain